MHVGYLVKRFPRVSETFIAQEILELERRGVGVTVLALRPNDQPAEHGWLDRLRAQVIPCHELGLSQAWRRLHRRARHDPSFSRTAQRVLAEAFAFPSNRGKRALSAATVIAETVAERRIDHLHAHFANQPSFVAYLAHRLSGVSYSFTGHAKDLYADALPPSLLRRLVTEAAFTVTVSEDNRRHLLATLGPTAAEKVVRIYNGVEVPDEPRHEEPPPSAPILSVARLVEKKGLDTLLDAMAALVFDDDSRSVLRLEIVGDGPLRESLHARARDLGLDDRIAWSGALPHEEVLARMRRARLFVLPCRVAGDGDQDALPTVLLEAMARGLACVSTPIGGVPEIVEHGATGLLVPPNDREALAAAISELLDSPEKRRRMGEAGHRRAARLFDRRTNVAALRERFEAAVEDHAREPDAALVETGS
ncbi:MAG: glycosyltransferase family 4 protein [Thermoanaerobaculia bacterium]|nr:glycosyltransferase family 4 protein [Thermoanaerobaculia bacterium]